jgi:peroxiredoxin
MKIYALLLLALLGFSTARAQDGLKVGDKAKTFTLKNIDGNMLSLEQAAGAKGAIVVFTCNHCPFSKMYEDRIIALQKEFGPKGFPVVAINPNDPKKSPEDSYDNMITRAKEKGFTFPYVYDETQAIAKAYGAARTPHVFVLTKGKDGLVVSYIGAIDDNANEPGEAKAKYVEAAVNNIIAGKKPEPDKTKAIGCTIKWREA